jgi:rSAM/selenodomain-associated transferase 1
MNNKNLLIVFAKNPIKGKVKTRLAKTIGDEEALQVYNKLLSYTLIQCKKLTNCSKHIYYSTDLINIHTDDFIKNKKLQKGNSLGEKMKNAFEKSFEKKYEKIILIGSDCPEIKAKHIEQAFDALESNRVVLGPATDGGYYLIGMQLFLTQLFENMPWSTNLLIDKTKKVLENEKISYKMLEILSDIDTTNDAKRFKLL